MRVRACAEAGQLLDWAAAWPQRIWAVGGARGMGYLLALQLVAAGEKVLDVQPRGLAREPRGRHQVTLAVVNVTTIGLVT